MEEGLFRLARGTVIYGIGQLLNRIIGFLLLPIFTAYLTPGDYGIIGIIGFISFLIMPVFGLGLGVAIGVLYFEGYNSTRKCEVIWTAFVILCISSTILFLIAFAFSRQISLLAFQTENYHYFIQLGVISTALGSIMVQPLMLRLQFEERAKLYVILSSISTVISISSCVFLVVGLRRGAQGYIEGLLIGSLCMFILFLVPVFRSTKFKINLSIGKSLLKYGVPLIPSFAFLFIMQHSGRYMLQWGGGLGEVGIYTIGYNFGMIMMLAVNAFATAWFPYFNSFVGKQEESKLIFRKTMTYYTLGFGALSLLSFIIAKPVVMIMTQEPFHDAYSVIGLISLGCFFSGIFNILLPGLYFAKRVYLVNFVQCSSAILCLFLNLILIPKWGIVGAAMSFLMAHLSMVLFQYTLNRLGNYLNVRYEWRRIIPFAILSTVFILICFVPRDYTAGQELLFSLCLMIALVIMIYAQLSKAEKQTIRVFTNHLKKGQSPLF